MFYKQFTQKISNQKMKSKERDKSILEYVQCMYNNVHTYKVSEREREREREKKKIAFKGRDRIPRVFVNYFFMLVFLYLYFI